MTERDSIKTRIQNDLAGQGATSRVTGAYFADGHQHLDYDTFQEHIAPSTTSDFAFKGALRDQATTVWRGMIRVEHEGIYAAVGSMGGAPKHPWWYLNLLDDPDVTVQDGTEVRDYTAREVTGDEKAEWWARAVEAWPDYEKYQASTDREIPVFVLEPRD